MTGYSSPGGIGRGGRRSGLRGGRTGVDPAGVHPAVETVGGLGIEGTLADQAAEGRLDMVRRAAEAVVEIEVAEGGCEIVASEQADHPPTKPDHTGSTVPPTHSVGGTRQ